MSGSEEEPGGRRNRSRLAAVLPLVPGVVMILLGTLMTRACDLPHGPDELGCLVFQALGLPLLLVGVGLFVLVVVTPRSD